MKKLLAIPNDETRAYFRSPKDDFLAEFNPKLGKKRFFSGVKFLNWKDSVETEYYGIKSFPILKNKEKAKELLRKLANLEIPFDSPEASFKEIFEKEEKEIRRFVEEFNPSLIRSFNTHFAIELGEIARKYSKSPLIVSVHDPARFSQKINYADKIFCISNPLKEIAIEKYKINPEKIAIVPDSIDVSLFKEKGPEKYRYIEENYPGKYKILSISRVVKSKNIETLLDAIGILRNRLGENISHIHLGEFKDYDKETEEKIRNKIKDNGLEKISYFPGGIKKEELPNYYSWANIYALPTLWEGLGRAQIESLACETPVITTNLPPMNQIIKNGYNGFTINPSDPQEISDSLYETLTNKKVYEEIKKNTRKSILGRYDSKTVTKKIISEYEKLLK